MPKKKRTTKKSKKLVYIIAAIVVIALLLILLIIQTTSGGIERGNTVSVDYILYLEDGSVFDTSIESVGLEASLEKSDYSPLVFIVGNQDVISGFEEEVIGLNVGDKKTFTLTSDRAYGGRNEDLVREFLRDLNLTRYSPLDIEVYESYFEKSPVIGDVAMVSVIDWNFTVREIGSENVTLEAVLEVGDRVQLPNLNWETVVLSKNEDTIILRQYPNIGDIISTPTNPKFAVITKVLETSFFADANSPLAGKTLTFEVEVLNIEN